MDNSDALERIAAQADRGDLAFSTHAEVTQRVRRALQDPDLHVGAAARLIQAEPVLAARVVAVANSAAFNNTGRPFADVRTAVARVGFRTARSLATAVLMQQLGGKAVTPAQRSVSARLWEHTAHVAALAQVLARRVTRLDPEIAMFAGIVHEVGGFYLLSRGAEYPELLEANAEGWLCDGEAIVGRAVLRALSVPEQVTDAMEYYWQGYLAVPPRTLGDTLLLADQLAPVQSPFQMLKDRNGEDVPCELEMLLGTETLTEILEESAGEVKSLAAALRL